VCEKCGPAYTRFCDHPDQQKPISGTWVRGLIRDGKTPERDVFRPEVFEAMVDAGQRRGFGSPFVGERYLAERTPVFTVPPRDGAKYWRGRITGEPSKQLPTDKEKVTA
jgi:sulfate adenylyltransferase